MSAPCSSVLHAEAQRYPQCVLEGSPHDVVCVHIHPEHCPDAKHPAPAVVRRHVSLVVDVSGSMEVSMPIVKDSLLALNEFLSGEDIELSLISFSNRAQVVWSKSHSAAASAAAANSAAANSAAAASVATSETGVVPATSLSSFEAAVESLRAAGSTNLHDGLVHGFEALQSSAADIGWVVVLTDGSANAGTYTTAEDLQAYVHKTVEGIKKTRIKVVTFGYGCNFSLETLTAIGTYAHIQLAEDIPTCLGALCGEISATCVSNVQVSFRTGKLITGKADHLFMFHEQHHHLLIQDCRDSAVRISYRLLPSTDRVDSVPIVSIDSGSVPLEVRRAYYEHRKGVLLKQLFEQREEQRTRLMINRHRGSRAPQVAQPRRRQSLTRKLADRLMFWRRNSVGHPAADRPQPVTLRPSQMNGSTPALLHSGYPSMDRVSSVDRLDSESQSSSPPTSVSSPSSSSSSSSSSLHSTMTISRDGSLVSSSTTSVAFAVGDAVPTWSGPPSSAHHDTLHGTEFDTYVTELRRTLSLWNDEAAESARRELETAIEGIYEGLQEVQQYMSSALSSMTQTGYDKHAVRVMSKGQAKASESLKSSVLERQTRRKNKNTVELFPDSSTTGTANSSMIATPIFNTSSSSSSSSISSSDPVISASGSPPRLKTWTVPV